MIKSSRIPFQEVGLFARNDLAYVNADPLLRDFYAHSVDLDAFQNVIAKKSGQVLDRQTLVSVIEEQYVQCGLGSSGAEVLLESNCFTVTTAHQPVIFGGPLYVVFKIMSTINLAQRLSERFPEYQFIPTFVVGGEDHDFEEMRQTFVFGKELIWENDESGSVGRMSTAGLQPVIADLKGILGDSEHAMEISTRIDESFGSTPVYGMAMQKFLAECFADQGLLVIQMDDPRLKARFADVLLDELENHTSRKLIAETQESLESRGFRKQAYLREVNLFFLNGQSRERIEPTSEGYQLAESGRTFSRSELQALVADHPESFSPNVNLRPLYQEVVLPNLAYIGGGGEIAYWLERKAQFEHYGIPFPMLIRRNSAMWLDRASTKQLSALGLETRDLFQSADQVINQWVLNNAEDDLQIEHEEKAILSALEAVAQKGASVDQSLGKSLQAEKVRISKQVEQLGKRILRAQKSKNEASVNKIKRLKEKLFPDGGLQERHENFMSLYVRYGKDLFTHLLAELDPLQPGFVIFEDVQE